MIGIMDIYDKHSDSAEAQRHLRATKRVLQLFRDKNTETYASSEK